MVDNNSTDRTHEVASSLGYVKVIHETVRGYGPQLQAAIRN